MTVAQEFGARLAQERRLKAAQEERDILKKDVAKTLGTSESTYGRWEAGLVMPDDDTMVTLANYFGVTPSWLRYGQAPRRLAESNGAASPDPAKDRKLNEQELARADRKAELEDRAAQRSGGRETKKPPQEGRG